MPPTLPTDPPDDDPIPCPVCHGNGFTNWYMANKHDVIHDDCAFCNGECYVTEQQAKDYAKEHNAPDTLSVSD